MVEFGILGDENIASSRILVPVAVATILPGVSLPVSGQIALTPSSGVSATVSSTISAANGTLYGVVVANYSTVAGTVALYAGGLSAPIIVIVPAEDIRGWINPKGVTYSGSLVASLMGTLQVTVM